jgi:pyruvate carboxylase
LVLVGAEGGAVFGGEGLGGLYAGRRSVGRLACGVAGAEAGNPAHVAAPMPGVISSVAVTEDQVVKSGDLLATIEAMKMETGLYADKPGKVMKLHVQPGAQVDAKDLLVELQLDPQ